MKNKNIILTLLIFINVLASAQMNFWTMPPVKVVMPAQPPLQQGLYSGAPGNGSYGVANGAYDPSGNLLFFVKNETIYSSTNVSIGKLGYNTTNSNLAPSSVPSGLGGEIVIVPVPGECKKYYVIYSRGCPNGGAIMYVIVDCTNATPTVIYADLITYNNAGISGPYRLAFDLGPTLQDNAGIAVGKKIGSGASAIYYMYVCNSTKINVHKISANGISAGSSLGNMPGGFYTGELELSPDGFWLAWSHYGTVCVVKLGVSRTLADVTTYKSHSYSQSTINGLEFSANSYLLYVAGCTNAPIVPIFDRMNVTTPTLVPTAIPLNTANLNTTFLEYGKNGNMYGIYNDGTKLNLLGFNENSGVITSSVIKVNSDHSNLNVNISPLDGIYTLPDQIDGEDYNNFSTFPIVTLNTAKINNSAFQNICNNFIEVYNCAGIFVNTTYNGGELCRYELDINPIDKNCNPLPINSNYFSYGNGSYPSVENAPTLNGLDLRNLIDQYSNSFNTKPGYYSVKIKVYDCCGTVSSQTAYIHVLQAQPPTLNLKISDYTQGQAANAYVSPSHNLATPNLMGCFTAAFQTTNTLNEVATLYSLKIDEINSGTGAIVKSIYDVNVPVSQAPNIAGQSLNQLCYTAAAWSPVSIPGPAACPIASPSYPTYSGGTGFFGYNNGSNALNKYYKLTVTLQNQCSSASNWAYLKFVNGYARPTGIENSDPQDNTFSVFPNPANNDITLKFNTVQDDTYSIVIYDISGRMVKEVMTGKNLESGEHTIVLNDLNLQAGSYTYKVNSAYTNKTGLINIIK